MANGFSLFCKLHPPGNIYRYLGGDPLPMPGWEVGKVYLLVRWEQPQGLPKTTPILDAVFLVDEKQCYVGIQFFKYLEKV